MTLNHSSQLSHLNCLCLDVCSLCPLYCGTKGGKERKYPCEVSRELEYFLTNDGLKNYSLIKYFLHICILIYLFSLNFREINKETCMGHPREVAEHNRSLFYNNS